MYRREGLTLTNFVAAPFRDDLDNGKRSVEVVATLDQISIRFFETEIPHDPMVGPKSKETPYRGAMALSVLLDRKTLRYIVAKGADVLGYAVIAGPKTPETDRDLDSSCGGIEE